MTDEQKQEFTKIVENLGELIVTVVNEKRTDVLDFCRELLDSSENALRIMEDDNFKHKFNEIEKLQSKLIAVGTMGFIDAAVAFRNAIKNETNK